MQDPGITLAHEPIASPAPTDARTVMQSLRAIHEEGGRTVICDLHALDAARRCCDRMAGMRAGRVLLDDPPAELTPAAASEIHDAGDDLSEAAPSTEIGAPAPAAAELREAEALVRTCKGGPLDMRTLLAGVARARDAASVEEFRIGLRGGENAHDRLASNECPREHTEEALGVPTRPLAPADHDGVIRGPLGGALDRARLGASACAAVHPEDPQTVEPVPAETNLDGGVAHRSIGFAREDAEIASLDGVEGERFGFGDPSSTSGHLVPSIEIPRGKDGITMEPGAHFADVTFAGGHEPTIAAADNGDVGAGGTRADGPGDREDVHDSGALRKAVDAGLADRDDLVEVGRSEPIPEGPIVLRADLPEDVEETRVEPVEGLHDRDQDCACGVAAGETLGLEPIGHGAYGSIIEAHRAAIGG